MTVNSLSWKDILDRKKFFLTKELMMAAAISVKYGISILTARFIKLQKMGMKILEYQNGMYFNAI